MSFLSNMYERRLNTNMRRHALDAKIALPKPKPSFRSQKRRPSESGADVAIMSRFLGSYPSQNSISMAGSERSSMTSSPTCGTVTGGLVVNIEQPAQIGISPAATILVAEAMAIKSMAAVLEMKMPLAAAIMPKPLSRFGSVESANFTDSDAASNVSA